MNGKNPLCIALCVAVSTASFAQTGKKYPDPAPMTHDMSEFWEPQPRIVTPADMDRAVPPPSDAVVLLGLDADDAPEWIGCDGKPVAWSVEDGVMTVIPNSGSIQTRRDFGDYQLHLEWSAPTEIVGESQGRGNSGVFMQGRYEVQILDNYGNETYANGQAGSIYKQSAPAGQRLPETGQMEHLRHHLHGAPVQGRRYAALARTDHRAAQRRADPEQHADPRHDGIHRFPENGRPRSRPDRAAGPPEPGPFPQYLDQGTVRQDAEARIPAGHSGDSRLGVWAIIHGMETFSPVAN